ncbi:MAG TPA: MFS transporter [Stellaceae bacterium]|jgi:putative MFS transporter|nr:MFS transporter [Stellaceae bacterium]
MPGQTSDELLALFDSAPLNRRYWVSFVLLSALFVLEFFDFLVVGYLLAVLGPQWHLTYGQSALILYSGGIGSILGALVFGGLADAWGRKTQMIIGTFICAVAAGLIGLVPSGSWQTFAVLRFFVGVGLTAGVTPSLTILVELTPTRSRTLLTSFYIVFASAGGLLASTTSAALLAALGWRGVAMLGVTPAFVGVLIWIFVPESVRWLVAKGRFAEARAGVARYLDLPVQSVPMPTVAPATQPRGSLAELYHHPRMFWETILIWGGSSTAGYGVYLWGPTIVALALGVSVPKAAAFFVFVALGGVVGKIVVTFLAPLIGRRPLGVLWGVGGVVALAAAGYYHAVLVGGLPLMVILLCASTFFIEGGFSNLAPYTVESYGVNLGARASGLGQAANGVGKILGPLSLALIAGSSNILSPKATADAVFPAYLFLAFCMALVALSFLVLGVETHGRTIAFVADETGAVPRPVLGAQAR